MARLSIKVDDKALREAIRIAPERIITAISQSLTRSAIQTQRYFRENIPVGVSGELRRSVRYHFLDRVSVSIAPEASYAQYVEYGTSPHWASVKDGTSLARWAKQKGINKYALQHHIARKGTKPHHFEGETYRQAKDYAYQDIDDTLNNTIKEILA